jgi:signal transduction histidine kinase/CheY-like chemotaxis protein/ligand-binding sensor domain-containing protein
MHSGWSSIAVRLRIASLLAALALASALVRGADAPRPLPPETGVPALRNFAPREYGAGQQNFALVQDHRGVLYAGNGDGVLEFDGARWRLIHTARRTAVRSLAVDDSGRVYVGAQGEFGYLAPDDAGEMRFVSLADLVPEESRDFEDVWGTFVAPEGIYFSTYAALFRLRGERVDVWKPETAFRLAFRVGGVRDRLFLRQVDRGLVELRDDRLEPVPGADAFGQEKIYTMVPVGGGAILVGTAASGLFLLDGGTVRPFATEADAELKKALVFKALWLADGRLAVGTLQGGVFILDSRGRLLGRLTKETGLQDENVKALLQDSQGGLWLALNNGLSRVEVASPLTAFGDRSGLAGAVICARAHRGALHVGTTQGLFRLEALNGGAGSFAAVPGITSETWDIAPFGDALLVANADGVYEVRGSEATLVWKSGVYASALLASRLDPARVFVGTQDGLASMRRDGGAWIDEGRVPGVRQEVRSLFEAPDGRLWLGTTGDGVLALAPPPGWRGGASEPAPSVERFGTERGLPSLKHVRVYELAGGPVFATQGGIFRLDARSERFEPDPRFSGLFPDGARWLMALREDATGRVWMHAADEARGLREAGAAAPGADGRYVWEPSPPLPITATDSDLSACVDEDGAVWFGSPADGLFRYDPAVVRTPGWQHPALVRRVAAAGGRALTGGATELPYADNDLRFEFAAPGFDSVEANRYQVMLEGNDPDWSPWSAETFKEYTNLPEGGYHFRVRARNVYGEVSPEAVYGFRVRPPWYRTWFAYLAYLAAALGAVYAFARVRTRALTRRTEALEAKIAERTAELAHSRKEALEANKAKSVFLANMSHELRTPLNAVIGFAQLMGRNRQIPSEEREHLEIIQRSGEHLLGLINDVLSISKIEAGRLALDVKSFDPRYTLDAVEAMTRVRAEAKGLALRVEVGREFPAAVMGDEGKLRQVLLNLLGNAVKFTSAGGVVLRAEWDATGAAGGGAAGGGRAYFEVEDTGEGISERELATLFEPFVQTETGRKAKEGTGLGLVISRQIVRLMGGDVSVRSEVGRGTTFRFEVALPEAESAAAAPRDRRVTGLAPGLRAARVLAVDDTREGRVLLSRLLAEVGFDVREAANGAEAVEVWRAWRPDLIFMDMRMPVMDGREATRRIRAREAELRGPSSSVPGPLPPEISGEEQRTRDEGQRTRIIALTASAFEHERDEIISHGADDFVTKPFREKTIFDKLAEHLGVTYCYEESSEERGGAAADSGDGADVLSRVRLAALPGELLSELHETLARGDFDAAAEVAERAREYDDALGAALGAEIRAFRLNELLSTLEQVDGVAEH